MKEKLQKYNIFLICAAIISASIISFYTYNFFLATIFLVIMLFIILYETININKENNQSSLITSKIKLNINDNISEMSYPIALIHENGEIIWGNKRFKKELSNKDIEEQNKIGSYFMSLDHLITLHLRKQDKRKKGSKNT